MAKIWQQKLRCGEWQARVHRFGIRGWEGEGGKNSNYLSCSIASKNSRKFAFNKNLLLLTINGIFCREYKSAAFKFLLV